MHETSEPAVVQTNPVITKALTSTGGFIVGDTLAQMATGGREEYDWCASHTHTLAMLALPWSVRQPTPVNSLQMNKACSAQPVKDCWLHIRRLQVVLVFHVGSGLRALRPMVLRCTGLPATCSTAGWTPRLLAQGAH